VCCFRHFVESNLEFVVHDVDQEPYASLAVFATPSHARVPIADDFVDTRMPPLVSALIEIGILCLPPGYHEHQQSAGIEIRFLEKLRLCGEFGTKFLRYKIRRGVPRGY
jgi:hypothetical protein